MRVLVTGATGFVGSHLSKALVENGHELVVLSRNPESVSQKLNLPLRSFAWDPEKEEAPVAAFEGVQAIVHLAGENVAARRWSDAQKASIRNSRVMGTRHLLRGAEKANQNAATKIHTVVSASAIGFYGDRGSEKLDETSAAGTGFLADVCKAWEAELGKHVIPNLRTVAIRVGMVLGAEAGALAKLLPVFKAGLGGVIGSGDQWISWIHIKDLVQMFLHALRSSELSGPMNGVAPNPVTNREFSKSLAEALHRPAIMKVPAVALRLAMGEMSEVILAGQRIYPQVALASGFRFEFPDVGAALEDIVKKKGLKSGQLNCEQWLPEPIEKVFKAFADEKNLEAITPPFLNFKVMGKTTDEIRTGTKIYYRLKIHGLPIRWCSVIEDWEPNKKFVDRQVSGPYKLWHHTHTFKTLAGGTLVKDEVLFQIPGGWLGRFLLGPWIRRDLKKIFNYRRTAIPKLIGPS